MCVMCGPNPSEQAIDHDIHHPMVAGEPDWQMCGECGKHVSAHPDKMDFLAKREMEAIIEHGHQVQLIFPHEGDDSLPFAYSVGRCIKDRPELLVHGTLHPQTMGYIVNRVAELDDEKPIKAGDLLDEVLEGYQVKIAEVPSLDVAEMYDVTMHFGEVPALQILWPDKEGVFPDEPGYADHNQTAFSKVFAGVLKECGQCGASVLCAPEEAAPPTCETHS